MRSIVNDIVGWFSDKQFRFNKKRYGYAWSKYAYSFGDWKQVHHQKETILERHPNGRRSLTEVRWVLNDEYLEWLNTNCEGTWDVRAIKVSDPEEWRVYVNREAVIFFARKSDAFLFQLSHECTKLNIKP